MKWEKYIKGSIDLDQLKNKNELQQIEYCMKHYKYDPFIKWIRDTMKITIFVICGGKCGSSTLTCSFNKNGYVAIHAHSNDEFLVTQNKQEYYLSIYELIEQNKQIHKNIYIIDSYRDPIERKLSSYFQHVGKDGNNMNVNYHSDKINKKIFFLETYHPLNHILEYFGLEKFNDFDHDKKYKMIKHENIHFIKIRFEDINKWKNIFESILGKSIKIVPANVSSTKSYSASYDKVKNAYKININHLKVFAECPEFKIYKTDAERKQYIEKWKLKSYDDNFDWKKYVGSDNKLMNINEIEAITHYEKTKIC